MSDPVISGDPLLDWWKARQPRERRAALIVLGFLAVLSLLPGLLWSRCGIAGCPNVHKLTAYQPGGAPRLLDRRGQVFATLAPVEGQIVRLDVVPGHVQEAFIAVEDQRFLQHHGVDWRRVWGAVLANLR